MRPWKLAELDYAQVRDRHYQVALICNRHRIVRNMENQIFE
jgi:hypothetical protein